MSEVIQQRLTGERAAYGAQDTKFIHTIFEDGESPLKESANIELEGCLFRWKYPLWYANNIHCVDTNWFDMARAGVWYSNNVTIDRAVIQAPKNFRRCKNLALRNVTMTNAAETLWSCKGVTMEHCSAKGDYFAMNSSDLSVRDFVLDGNYSFDGCTNVVVEDARLLSKDAFWNCENVVVRNSFISGEYLGWNSENITFENCTIESLQGICYIKNVKLVNCTLINTTLCFEYCEDIDAQVNSPIDSVLNPRSGKISAPAIKELIVEENRVDSHATDIDCHVIGKKSKHPEWINE